MNPAIYDVCRINLTNDKTKHVGFFQGLAKSLSFEGFLRYSGSSVEEKKSFDDIQSCHLIESEIKETESNPPQFYNESTIVKKLESSGVGRPSTYASIVNTLYNRKYTVTKDVEGKSKKEPYYKLDENDEISKGVHTKTLSKQKKRITLTDLGETVLDYLLKHFSTMICIQFTAQVESDLDLISTGQADLHTIMKKVYDAFNPIVIEQMAGYEIKTGKFGPYMNVSGKNYGLTNYLEMKKIKIEDLTEEDIETVIQYPKKVGKYKEKDITLHIGQHSIYMKYNDKNFRLDKLRDHSLDSLSSLLS